MKRDMDLVRKILLALEEHEHGFAPQNFLVDGYSEEQVGYHIHIMNQAGLIHAVDITSLNDKSPQAIPSKLTWEGYEFLEAAREPTRWQAALTKAKEKGAALTFDILKAILVELSLRAVSDK